jgi:hypothetical protein
MKKQCVGLVLILGLTVGCASRTRIDLGPVRAAGEVQVFESFRPFSFDLGFQKIGLVVGYLGCEIESSINSSNRVIDFKHSTGDSGKVFNNVPSLENDS